MLLNKILACLVAFGGVLICGVLMTSLGWNEDFDSEYKTAFYIAVFILMPLSLIIAFRLWRRRN